MQRANRGFSLLEVVVSIALIAVLLSTLLPMLWGARASSRRAQCESNLEQLGKAWHTYLEDHDLQFPFVPVQPGWRYGGVRFSPLTDEPFLDSDRPLNQYLGSHRHYEGDVAHLYCCPADDGIVSDAAAAGTAQRTAFRSFGTSYRANPALLDARRARLPGEEAPGPRGLRRGEITTTTSRLVLMGDAVWYEIFRRTGRDADWHVEPGEGNLLFLDGSVRFMAITPHDRRGPAVVEPVLP